MRSRVLKDQTPNSAKLLAQISKREMVLAAFVVKGEPQEAIVALHDSEEFEQLMGRRRSKMKPEDVVKAADPNTAIVFTAAPKE